MIKVNSSSEHIQWFQGDQAKEDCCHLEARMKPHINISDQFIDVCSLFWASVLLLELTFLTQH